VVTVASREITANSARVDVLRTLRPIGRVFTSRFFANYREAISMSRASCTFVWSPVSTYAGRLLESELANCVAHSSMKWGPSNSLTDDESGEFDV
jgi:hypothetical protein